MNKKASMQNQTTTEIASEQGLAKREAVSMQGMSDQDQPQALAIPLELDPEFANLLHEIEQGFDGFARAGAVWERCQAGENFAIIDGYNTEYYDKEKKEVLPKTVFTLEMDGGDVVRVMQGGQIPRVKYARVFEEARARGVAVRLYPVKFKQGKNKVSGNYPYIFEPQKGFKPQIIDLVAQEALQAQG